MDFSIKVKENTAAGLRDLLSVDEDISNKFSQVCDDNTYMSKFNLARDSVY